MTTNFTYLERTSRFTTLKARTHDATFLATLRNNIFLGVSHDARNVAKVEHDSTSATVARNFARKAAPCILAFNVHTLQANVSLIQLT